MSKKKKKKEGLHTPLQGHARTGKVITPPIMNIANIALQSWLNDRLPEMIWAALIVGTLPRSDALAIFRQILRLIRAHRDDKELENFDASISALAAAPDRIFKAILRPILAHPLGYAALRPMLLLGAFPGHERWRDIVDAEPQKQDWQTLSNAVLMTLEHQSQESTDCRWLTVMALAAQGRVHLPDGSEEMEHELLEYPNRGDMRSVRPTIRSIEGAFRLMRPNDGAWNAQFWKCCFEKTPCQGIKTAAASEQNNHEGQLEEIQVIWAKLREHFHSTITTTAVDPRHEACFGFAFYALALMLELSLPGTPSFALGRSALRTLIECQITFAYLLHKATPDLWLAHRKYGTGQAKLAFLKLEEQVASPPGSVDPRLLEALANEDAWLEFAEVNIGNWAGIDLRLMAEQSGLKAEYDRFYGWPSAYVHGNWGALRDMAFMTCLNPLHRLHRVPRGAPRMLESVLADARIITNNIFDSLNTAYPSFDYRLEVPDPPPASEGHPLVS